MDKIVLASKSPRRKELLNIIFDDFIIFPDSLPEKADINLSPEKYVMKLAEDKALNVSKHFEDDYLIIGADTVVVKDGVIFGKPKSKEEAFRMLKTLDNSTHCVYTGVAVYKKKDNRLEVFYEKTDVYFLKTDDNDYLKYIEECNPMDKAGSYGIQEKGALFVRKIDGDINNVIGLPVSMLSKVLKEKFDL